MLFKDCGCSFFRNSSISSNCYIWSLRHGQVVSPDYWTQLQNSYSLTSCSCQVRGNISQWSRYKTLLLYFGGRKSSQLSWSQEGRCCKSEEVEWLWFYHWLTYTLALKYCFLGLCYIDLIMFLCVSSWKAVQAQWVMFGLFECLFCFLLFVS